MPERLLHSDRIQLLVGELRRLFYRLYRSTSNQVCARHRRWLLGGRCYRRGSRYRLNDRLLQRRLELYILRRFVPRYDRRCRLLIDYGDCLYGQLQGFLAQQNRCLEIEDKLIGIHRPLRGAHLNAQLLLRAALV